ncbi:MAG: DUF4276 family protein [Armatimonadetes bacterium]|nr:DUF4276 family protein [Armatimonadota bacterium]
MASEIRIYFEGDSKLKRGFNVFFRGLVTSARARQVRWHLVAGGSINDTCDDFSLALRKHPNAFNVLLVDADCAVGSTGPWEHLENFSESPLSKLPQSADDHLHLMVQLMEAWFIADKVALEHYYGQGFAGNRLPNRPDVESIRKADVMRGLAGATKNTKKGKYHKTKHAPDLLERIDPAKVRACAPWCNRLFETLERIIEDQI